MHILKLATFMALGAIAALTVTLAVLLVWLVHSETGSRWLLDQGLRIAPIDIQARGISGTLAEGLGVEHLSIVLPRVEIHASAVVTSWNPARLLGGEVAIQRASIAELDIDVLPRDSDDDSSDDNVEEDRLFWLQIPVDINIESGQLGRLRIEEAEFENLSLAGNYGKGRLQLDSLSGETVGLSLQASGHLIGPDPGQIEIAASWAMLEQNLRGSGSFNGNINKLKFSQLIHVPETVNFDGALYDLFTAPSLAGVAEWASLRVPGETALSSEAGKFSINSDFRSARIEGRHIVLLESWPQAPMELAALVDLKGVTIDNYILEALSGQVSGSGQIDYSEGLQGQLAIKASQIDTSLVNANVPGQLDFDAMLVIESPESFSFDVNQARAVVHDRTFDADGRVEWSGAKLAAITANINTGRNRLTADIKLGPQLVGSIQTDAPELGVIWPGLKGMLDASVTLAGSIEQPQANVRATGENIVFDSHSLEKLTLTAVLQKGERLTGNMIADGLESNGQELGNLDFGVAGTLAAHQSDLSLAGGVIELKLRSDGGWDGKQLIQRFTDGTIRPEGLPSWRLDQTAQLQLSAAGGQVSAHCWKQNMSSICIKHSEWSTQSLKSAIVINDFALATLEPLLVEGNSIDGSVDASLRLERDSAGMQAELHWQQSRTVLGFDDGIDKFQTIVDHVQIDLDSSESQTNLVATLSGEQGLEMKSTAIVKGPLIADSPLKATAKGRIPSIELLRPLFQRVVHPGEIKGELTLDLNARGTLGDPVFDGGAYLVDGSLGLVDAGVTLSHINIKAESDGSDKLRVTGDLRSGDGSATILGEVRATEELNLEADVRVQGQNLASLRLPDLSVDTSPDLTLRIGEDIFDISGTLAIPRATAQIRDLPQGAVPSSPDVVVHAPERTVEQPTGTIVTGNVEVVLGEDVRFSGFGLNARLDGGLRLTQAQGDYLRTRGTVRVRDGFLTGYGRELRVDRGELTFVGPLDDPLINIQVSRESIYEGRRYIIGLRLTGSGQNVITEPFSRPSMSEQDVLTFLLLDRPATSDADASGAALALGLQQMVPGDSGGVFGLDEVSFETNDANEAAMVAGRRINENLFVRYVFGTRGEPGSFRIRYSLGRGFSLEASTGSRQSLDLIYLLER
jgi:translocation and assembly module TamB